MLYAWLFCVRTDKQILGKLKNCIERGIFIFDFFLECTFSDLKSRL